MKVDLLVLGVESEVGQRFYKILKRNYPLLKVAVIAKEYGPGIDVPSCFVPLDMNSRRQIERAFQLTRAVVICDIKYSTEDIQRAAKRKLIQVSSGHQLVIEAALEKIGFFPQSLELRQDIRTTSLWSIVCGAKALKQPEPLNKQRKWGTQIDLVEIQKLRVPVRVECPGKIWAMIIWFFAFLARFIPFKKVSPLGSWKMIGRADGNGKQEHYSFDVGVSLSSEVDTQADLLLCKTVKAILDPKLLPHQPRCDSVRVVSNLKLVS